MEMLYHKPPADRVLLALTVSCLSISMSGWLYLLRQYVLRVQAKHKLLELTHDV